MTILDARKEQASLTRLRIYVKQATFDLRSNRERSATAASAVPIARRGPLSGDLSRALEMLGQNANYATTRLPAMQNVDRCDCRASASSVANESAHMQPATHLPAPQELPT